MVFEGVAGGGGEEGDVEGVVLERGVSAVSIAREGACTGLTYVLAYDANAGNGGCAALHVE